jgi:hypothetical protein
MVKPVAGDSASRLSLGAIVWDSETLFRSRSWFARSPRTFLNSTERRTRLHTRLAGGHDACGKEANRKIDLSRQCQDRQRLPEDNPSGDGADDSKKRKGKLRKAIF